MTTKRLIKLTTIKDGNFKEYLPTEDIPRDEVVWRYWFEFDDKRIIGDFGSGYTI